MGFFKTLELLFSGDVEKAKKVSEESESALLVAEEAAMVEPLTGGLKWELRDRLLSKEKVSVIVKGCNGEAIVITDKRVIILKAGYASGSWAGRKCTAFGLDEITAVGFHCGFDKGLVQVVGEEVPDDNDSLDTMTRASNVINFPADKAIKFRRIVEMLHKRTEENKKRQDT
jgi:hypothetical protein